MIRHSRDDWTSTPAADAHPFAGGLIRGIVVHWNGPKVPQSALTDPRAYLEGVRRYHTSVKGWSDIAYNVAVDQRGHVWMLRGMRHQSAANGDEHVNARWVAVLGIIGQGQEPTEAMLDGIRDVAAWTRRLYPQATAVRGHKDVRPEGTACPGPDLYRAVNTNRFVPRTKHIEENVVDKKDIKQIADATADEVAERLMKRLKNMPNKVVDELVDRAADKSAKQ